MATLRGRLLLGWMPRDEAVRFLTTDCVFDPPIDAAAAEALWAEARARVDALAIRPIAVVQPLGLSTAEAGHQANFLGFMRSIGVGDVLGLRKVDLRGLVARQYYVVTERAESYAQRLQTPRAWLDEMLPTSTAPKQLQAKSQQTGNKTYTEFDVPHAEFMFGPVQNPAGMFSAQEFLRHVTVMDGADRTYLWAGYHRCFARMASAPPAAVPSAVVAVATNVLVTPAPTIAADGEQTIMGVDPLGLFGAKPPLFGDFFVEGLFMDVNLRKKRYQLQVHANMVALDDDR